MRSSFSATITTLLASNVDCFMVPSRLAMRPASIARHIAIKARPSNYDLAPKEFQLEELEDKEECETEVWLNQDGTVTLGKTNGPSVKNYRGDWHVIETALEGDRPFRMRLTRVYDASGHSGQNQIGDFSYEVTREFHGNVEMVGDSISVTGKTHGIDEQSLLDAEVGYFTMIDAVASEGIEGERYQSDAALSSIFSETTESSEPIRSTRSSTAIKATMYDLAPKEFQLEELEDKEESETEVWLNQDGTVTLGKTNGPSVKDYSGDWHIIETALEEDKPFRMRLTRVYDAAGHSGPNQIGDFSYEVTREFHGNVEMIGDSISVTGKTHGIDEQSQLDAEVGYFTMIDAVASEGIEGERK